MDEAAARGDVVEAMRFDPLEGILDLEAHLAGIGARMAAGARYDRHGLRNELHAATFRRTVPGRVVLRIAPGGATAIEVRDG